MEIKKKEILEQREQLNEALLSWENALMAAGFIPVIGEVADIALIIYYLKKGEKLYAALMLIALVPTVGDIAIKPFIKLLKGVKGEAKIAEALAKQPAVAAKVTELANSTVVKKTVENLSKVNKGWGASLGEAISKLKVIGGIKGGAKEVAKGGSFAKGMKNFYQGEKIAKYAAKQGIPADKIVLNWWQKYGARTDRRNSFRRFIMANNMLAFFGIPTLTTFEHKMDTDPEFRNKVANNDAMSQYIGQNTAPATGYNYSEPSTTADNQQTDNNGGILGGIASLSAIKMLARMYA